MSKKNKKKKQNIPTEISQEPSFDLSGDNSGQSLDKGTRTIKDIFAPSYIGHPSPDHIIVDNKYVRSYALQGYPMNIHVK